MPAGATGAALAAPAAGLYSLERDETGIVLYLVAGGWLILIGTFEAPEEAARFAVQREAVRCFN